MSENYQNLKRAIDMMHSQNVQKFRGILQKREQLGQRLDARIDELEKKIDALAAYVDIIHTDGDSFKEVSDEAPGTGG